MARGSAEQVFSARRYKQRQKFPLRREFQGRVHVSDGALE